MAPRPSIGFNTGQESHRHFFAVNPASPLPHSLRLRINGVVAGAWIYCIYRHLHGIYFYRSSGLHCVGRDVGLDDGRCGGRQRKTNQQTLRGLFFAARSFAGKFVSASGIISAGVIITAVGFDSITSLADFTGEHRVKLARLFLLFRLLFAHFGRHCLHQSVSD